MLKISYAGCLGLSPVISEQFTLEMCVAGYYHEKFTKKPYLGLEVIDICTLESSLAVLFMISCKSVSICSRSHAKRVNSGKITIS